MSKHSYWVVRDCSDAPIELVRVSQGTNVVVAGEFKGTRQHKRSSHFTTKSKPDLNQPVTFDLIHAGDASAPSIGIAIAEIEQVSKSRRLNTTKRKQYLSEKAQEHVRALLKRGSGIREIARLTRVPRSTVADWAASFSDIKGESI